MTKTKQMCYNSHEVTTMDEKIENQEELPAEQTPAEETPVYMPRPAWQVWLARIGLVLFVATVLLYYANMMWGGK